MLDRVPYIAPAGVEQCGGKHAAERCGGGVDRLHFRRELHSGRGDRGRTAPLAQTLGCVTVRTGDRLLPLFFVSPSQINVQLPDDTATGDQG